MENFDLIVIVTASKQQLDVGCKTKAALDFFQQKIPIRVFSMKFTKFLFCYTSKKCNYVFIYEVVLVSYSQRRNRAAFFVVCYFLVFVFYKGINSTVLRINSHLAIEVQGPKCAIKFFVSWSPAFNKKAV